MNIRDEIMPSAVGGYEYFRKHGQSFRFFKTADWMNNVKNICSTSDLDNIYFYLITPSLIETKFINLNKVVTCSQAVLLKLILSSSPKEMSVRYFNQKSVYIVLSSKKLIFGEKEVDFLISHLPDFRPKILEGTSLNLDAKLTISQFLGLKQILLSFPKNINITYNSCNNKNKITLSSNDPDDNYLDDGSISNFQFQETFILVRVDRSVHENFNTVSTKQEVSAEGLQNHSILDVLDSYLKDNTLDDDSILDAVGACLKDNTLDDDSILDALGACLKDGAVDDDSILDALGACLKDGAVDDDSILDALGACLKDGAVDDDSILNALDACLKDDAVDDDSILDALDACLKDNTGDHDSMNFKFMTTF